MFVESGDHRIFRVAPSGEIATFAGTGQCGSTGDGGPASAAQLCWPSKISGDKQGNVYFVDHFVRIRRVSPDGIISTIFGGDERFHPGDGKLITDLATDSGGNLYIGESGAYRIRRLSPDGRADAVAGTGELSNRTTLPGPEGRPGTTVAVYPSIMAIDVDGSVLIYDPYVRSYQLNLLRPDGLMLLVYWADQGVANDGIVRCRVASVTAMVFDESSVIATEGSQLCRFDKRGAVSWIAGARFGFGGDDGPATDASFAGIGGLAVDREGNIYVADTLNRRIRKLTRMKTEARP